jgi:RNA polymerase sigma factor (sigma-70 family)
MIDMMWSAADDALLAGYANGDPDASVAFVRRHQRRVFGLALSIVSDAALAEDVAQEAFTRAWRHATTYDTRRGSVPAWLLTITRNLAIDAIRLRRARPIDPEVIAGMAVEATGQGSQPAAAAEASADADRLRVALALLPVDQRRALVLAALCGRTAKEVSETEGIPLGTAKTRIRTGMQRLRVALDGDDIDMGEEVSDQ